MRNILALILCLLLNNTAQTQNYWQQNADYKINVDVNAKNNTYKGNQEVIYKNNSRDSLNSVKFTKFNPMYHNLYNLQNVHEFIPIYHN